MERAHAREAGHVEPEASDDVARTLVPEQVHRKTRLKVRTRLVANRALEYGIVRQEMDWIDVLHAPPPAKPVRGTGAYVVPLWTEVAPEYRFEYATRVVCEGDGDIDVEDILVVRPRLMLQMLRRHRERNETRRHRWTSRLNARAAGRLLRAVELGGFRGRMHRSLGRFERKHGARLIHWMVAFVRWFVELPDRTHQRMLTAGRYLTHGIGRKELRRGVWEPRILTVEGKSVLLLLAMSTLVVSLIALHLIVTLAAPALSGPWRGHLALFSYGVATAIALPTPFEPFLLPFFHAGLVPAALAIANSAMSRVVGGWLVFFLGDEINGKMEEMGRKRPWIGKTVHGLERFADKFGLAAVIVLMSIPLTPDTIVIYIFGTVKMPLRKFLLGLAIGSVIRFTIVGVLFYYGADIAASVAAAI